MKLIYLSVILLLLGGSCRAVSAEDTLANANAAFRFDLAKAEHVFDTRMEEVENAKSAAYIDRYTKSMSHATQRVMGAWETWYAAVEPVAPTWAADDSNDKKVAAPVEEKKEAAPESEMLDLAAIDVAAGAAEAELKEEVVTLQLRAKAEAQQFMAGVTTGSSQADCVVGQHYLSRWSLDHWWFHKGCFSNMTYCRNPDWNNGTCRKCLWWAKAQNVGTGAAMKQWCAVTWWAWLLFYLMILVCLVFWVLVVLAIMKFVRYWKAKGKAKTAKAGYKELHDVELARRH